MKELESATPPWATTTLGDLSEVKSGVGFPKKYQGQSYGDYPVYKVGDVSRAVTQGQGLLNAANHYVTREEAGALKGVIFRAGSTLFAKIGEAVKLNRRAFVMRPGLADNNVMAVIPLLNESNKYLHYFLRTVDLSDVSRSTTVPSVRKGDIEELIIPLPPLAEQKVIANKLDTLLAQVENTKARLERIPQILKRFRQSVLAAAVSRRLTEDGDVGDGNWLPTKLANLCVTAFDGPFGSKLKSSDYTDGGVGVVRLENIRHLRFDQSKETFISEDKYLTLIKNKLEKNDILFSSFVDEEVRACLFPFEARRFINKADCFCLRIDQEKALPEFVLYLLTSQISYAQIKEHVQGVTRPRVNLKILKSLEFPVPPLQVQARVVGKVDQLFAHANRIEQQVNKALARVNNLTQSILAKAFRGELTEQWRKDNPELISGENSAEALLEKIKAEREAVQQPKRSKRKA
ncbi:restriction endonuclease subunit S [Marinobacter sp.]|uniref:restriction endonuclease subunit S n=1 Tax=Marinobacter sp. TaxID=50741 RepID=UPI003A951EB2